MINVQCSISLRIHFGGYVTNGMFNFVVLRVDSQVTPECLRSVSGIQVDC